MWFFKKSKAETPLDLGPLVTDMHSHLVPGIDDGSPDLATSVELIRGFAELGYKKLITTPHILWEIYPNTAAGIRNGLQEVQAAVQAAGIDIELQAAAEYFIDDHFSEMLQQKEPLLTLSGNLVLVEFSMVTAPMDLKDVLFELQLQNYQPVIAHPERYTYLWRKKEFFQALRDNGCLLQLNLLSLTGYYGGAVQELAEYLAKSDLYDLAGSDLHNARHLQGIRRLGSNTIFRKLLDSGRLRNAGL